MQEYINSYVLALIILNHLCFSFTLSDDKGNDIITNKWV